MKKAYQPENTPLKQAIAILEASGWLVLRQKQIPVKGRKFTGKRGVPDILAVRQGVCIGVEVKTETGKLSDDQIAFRAEWEGQKMLYIEYRKPLDLVHPVVGGLR